MLNVVIIQPVNSVYVGHSKKRPCWRLEFGVELLYKTCRGWVGEKDVNGPANLCEGKVRSAATFINVGTDNFLDMSHEISKIYEADLGLQVSVLAKMSSGVAERNFNLLIRIQANITNLFSALKLS